MCVCVCVCVCVNMVYVSDFILFYFSMFVCIYRWVGWKVLWLIKIFLWNVTKWGLFFKIVLLGGHTFLQSVLQCLDSIIKKRNQYQFWHYLMNFSGHLLFSPPSYLSIYLSIYRSNIYVCVCVCVCVCVYAVINLYFFLYIKQICQVNQGSLY